MRNYCKKCGVVAIPNDAVLCDNCKSKEKVDQYPRGTDLLWMAHYRKNPDVGAMDGFASKISGTLKEAAKRAQEIAEEENAILQCLRRRY